MSCCSRLLWDGTPNQKVYFDLLRETICRIFKIELIKNIANRQQCPHFQKFQNHYSHFLLFKMSEKFSAFNLAGELYQF